MNWDMNKKGYIDPGTGSMVAASIWPMIVAGVVFIGGIFVKIFINPIKKGFSAIFKKKQ